MPSDTRVTSRTYTIELAISRHAAYAYQNTRTLRGRVNSASAGQYERNSRREHGHVTSSHTTSNTETTTASGNSAVTRTKQLTASY